MKAEYWVLLLAILLALSVLSMIGILIFNRIMNRLRNGLVVRIFMADSTIRQKRYDEIPTDNKIIIYEIDNLGKETSFTYIIKEECIFKGKWGKYIDYDYHVATPVNPKSRSDTSTLNELKELFKLVGALLDTDLHVKLLRSSKFEEYMKMMMLVLVIINLIIAGVTITTMVKSFIKVDSDKTCTLKLDNSTWRTIYIASHTAPPQQLISGNS